MEQLELKVLERDKVGKNANKSLRKDGYIPCVMYKSNEQTRCIKVLERELARIKSTGGENALVDLVYKGKERKKVIIKDIQYHPVKGKMIHVDFFEIEMDKELETKVPLKVIGKSEGIKQGGILEHTLWELDVSCLPINIPEYIEIDISNLEIGDSLHVKDIKVPDGVKVLTDAEQSVVSVIDPREEIEEVVEEVPEEEGKEPEVLREKKKEGKEEKEEGKTEKTEKKEGKDRGEGKEEKKEKEEKK
jgi:large subunit ribosomal protein L25